MDAKLRSIRILALGIPRRCGRLRTRHSGSSNCFSYLLALAGMYAIGDYLQRDWLLIPRMASTHGVLNGLGFVMFGLLGWLVESSQVGVIKTYVHAARVTIRKSPK